MHISNTGKVLKNSAYYSIGLLLSRATGFFLLPIYTFFLSTEEYGIVNLISTFINVASVIILFAIDQGAFRFYEDYKEEKHKYFGTIITFEILVSVILFLALIITNKYITKFLLKGVDFYPIVLFGLIALLFNTIYIIGQSALQIQQKSIEFTKNSIIFVLIHALFNVIFLAVFNMKESSIILSLALTNIIMALKTIYGLHKLHDYRFGIDVKILRKVLAYSLPLAPHTLANNITVFVSQFFLNTLKSISQVGIYGLASQFGSILDMILSSINLAFRPWFNENIVQGTEGKQRIIEFSNSVFILSSIICLGISLFSKEIIYIMTTSEYHDAWKIVPLIAIAHVVKFIYYTHSLGVMYDLNSSRKLFMCSITASAINIGINVFLIPYWGMYGAAFSLLISRIVLATITVWISIKTKLIIYKLKNMIVNVILVVIASMVGLFFSYIGYFNGINIVEVAYKVFLYITITLIMIWKYKKQIIEIIPLLLRGKSKQFKR
jgi:O-antigen/teichoic acid export membrane protein